MSELRRFAVIGDPIAHSISPALHEAAYRALGIADARYERVRVASDGFDRFAREQAPRFDGLSVTMPHKAHAFALASVHDEHAALGVANTLVPLGAARGAVTRWAGFNTDIYGIVKALKRAGLEGAERATIYGSGATALSLATALMERGCTTFTLCARSPHKLAPLVALLEARGRRTRVLDWERAPEGFTSDVVGSALALGGAEHLAKRLNAAVSSLDRAPRVLFDVLYAPHPTPLTRTHRLLTQTLGAEAPALATGAHMLTYQSARQVELMLGIDVAPVEAMEQAAFGHVSE
ncbi:MAG: shikimate dehydrogenase [Dermabacter sp.]|nr:shikimate dehydrogenase [Dermabacter sp.]